MNAAELVAAIRAERLTESEKAHRSGWSIEARCTCSSCEDIERLRGLLAVAADRIEAADAVLGIADDTIGSSVSLIEHCRLILRTRAALDGATK